MNIKTMLLPTGEFLLIVSEVDPMAPQGQFLDAFTHVKNSAGAAGCFITTQDVDVVDAGYHANAVRREPPLVVDDEDDDKWWEDAPTTPQKTDGSFFIAPLEPKLPAGYKDLGMMDATEARNFFQFDSEADQAVLRAVNEGRTFGPGGLVKGRPGDPQFTKADLEGPADLHAQNEEIVLRAGDLFFDENGGPQVISESQALEVYRGVLTGDVREMAMLLNIPPRLFEVDGGGQAEHAGAPPRIPQPGDTVRITAAPPGHLRETPIGVEGEVLPPPAHLAPGEVYVDFMHPDEDRYSYRWFFPRACLEVIS